MDGVPPEEEEIPAYPITPETRTNAAEQQSPPGLNAAGLNAADAPGPEEQLEQIEADNAFAVQIQADKQIEADNALARQLMEPHSITVPRQWPANGQIHEPADTPGARGSRDIRLPDPNNSAGHSRFQETVGEAEEQIPVTCNKAGTQASAPTPSKIGYTVQLPALYGQPIARNKSLQDERKPKENPIRTRTVDQHLPGLRAEFQL